MIFSDTVRPDFGIPWPRFERKDYATLPEGELVKDFEIKAKIESLAREDPIKFGWILETWSEVCENWCKYGTHVVLGGNRSSKSVLGSRIVVDLLEKIPEARIRAYQVNEEKSIEEQQAYVWDTLPDKYKNLEKRRSSTHSIQYSQQNGFVGGKLILPPQEGYRRGSELIFSSYQAYRNDPQTCEGFWCHVAWCDEEVPQKMFERLLTRLYDARGRMLLTFTTIEGWSALISDILGRTKILRRERADLDPIHRMLAVAEESVTRKSTRVYHFWTQNNPFIPSETVKNLEGRPEAEVLAVAFGIPTRSATTKFPKFSEAVHVIKNEALPWKKAENAGEGAPEITYYQVIDPGGSKMWFCIWAGIDQYDNIYIFKEFPDGIWGEPSEKAEGSAGPAQKGLGWGISDYIEMFSETEQGFEVFERVIDPRMGASERAAKDGSTNLITELEDSGLILQPAPGQRIDHGEGLINDRLSYDETHPVDAVNHPRLYITENCLNVIEAIKNYTGCSREEVWKDPIDCVRYLLENGADFVSKSGIANTERDVWGYGGSPGHHNPDLP